MTNPFPLRHLAGCLAVGCLFLSLSPLIAQEDTQDPATLEPVPVMVMRADAKLQLDNKVVATAEKGEVLETTLTNGDWYWVPARDGWIHDSDIEPLDRAMKAVEQGLKKNKSAALYEQRALVHLARGNLDAAIADLDRALKADDRKPSILINRGIAWRRGNNYEQAYEDFSLAQRMDPKSTIALNNRAALLIEYQRPKEAMSDIEQVLKLDRESAEAYLNRGLIRLNEKKLRSARQDLDRAIELKPGLGPAYLNRGLVNAQEKKTKEAVEDFTKAAALSPSLPEPHNNLAWMLATVDNDELRKPDLAVEHSLAANRLTGFKNWNYLDTLGTAYLAAHQFKLAEKSFKQAERLAPKNDKSALKKKIQGIPKAKAEYERELKAREEAEKKRLKELEEKSRREAERGE